MGNDARKFVRELLRQGWTEIPEGGGGQIRMRSPGGRRITFPKEVTDRGRGLQNQRARIGKIEREDGAR